MARNGVSASRAAVTQNSSATAASSNPAVQQSSGSSSSDETDSQPSAFMTALMSATLDDSGSHLLAKPMAAVGANFTGNSRRPNTLKSPSQTGNRDDIAVAVPTSLTTPTVLPLRFSLSGSDSEQEAALCSASSGVSSDTAAQADGASEPANRAADAATAAEAQDNSSEELTFAARVQPVKPVTEAASAQPQAADSDAAALKRAAASSAGANASSAASGTADAAPSAASTLFATEAAAAFRQNDQAAANLQTAPPTSSQPVEALAPAPPKPAAAPLQDISLQVGQAGAPKVEIHLVQQSGELQVAVRTGDADLSHGLQQGLPDLVGRLQENGFRAEAWRPGADSHPATVIETKSSSGSSSSGNSQQDSQSGTGGSRQQSGQKQQNPSRRPAWVDELEARIDNQHSTGESYGIRN